MKNIGILGGTFDPIHLGHLIIAEQTRLKLRLGRVLFVPAGQPWLKADHTIAPQDSRVEMVRLAIAGNPYFELSRIEVERPGPSYTVDTLMALRGQLGAEVKIFFILGSDNLVELTLWKEPAKLVELCKLVVVPRLGIDVPDLKSLEASIPGISDSVIQLELPIIEISSSQMRQRVAEGLSIRYLVPDEVEQYIVQHSLYR